MKVLIATDSFLPSVGGMETVTYNLAKNLVSRGHSVSVLVNLRRFPFRRYEEIDSFRIYRIRMGIFDRSFRSTLGFLRQTPAAALAIYRILKKEDPDVVNLHFLTSGVATYMRFFKNICRYKLVASAHGSDILIMPRQSKSYLRAAQKVLKKADTVTACSKSLLDSAIGISGGGIAKSLSIYNGINLDDFERSFRDEDFIFTACRLVWEKGIDILIRAFGVVKDKGFKGSLVIAGDGPERMKLQSLISDLELRDSVTLLGMITPGEVRRYLGMCAFSVMPSRIEAFGLLNLEAMASGKTVIASDVNGIPELVINGHNGLLFRSEDHLDLAAKMQLLITDVNLRHTLAANGKRFVNGNFSWIKMTDSYERVYNMALEGERS